MNIDRKDVPLLLQITHQGPNGEIIEHREELVRGKIMETNTVTETTPRLDRGGNQVTGQYTTKSSSQEL